MMGATLGKEEKACERKADGRRGQCRKWGSNGRGELGQSIRAEEDEGIGYAIKGKERKTEE